MMLEYLRYTNLADIRLGMILNFAGIFFISIMITYRIIYNFAI